MMSNAAVASATVDSECDADRMHHPACGSQVILDLYECDTTHLDDLQWVKTTLVNAARAAGATIVETVFHKFAPWGISGVVVIAESHLAIHIWPENRYAAIDVFTCGENVLTQVACTFLKREFRARRAVQRRFRRGDRAAAAPDPSSRGERRAEPAVSRPLA
jgi:S-adenosylmethionine decarboxylase